MGEPPSLEQEEHIAILERYADVVEDSYDGAIVVQQPACDVEEVELVVNVEARRGLVEEEILGLARLVVVPDLGQHTRELHLLLLPAG